jgi:hypothetical protein
LFLFLLSDDSDDDTKIINGKSWPFAAKRGDLNVLSSSKVVSQVPEAHASTKWDGS